MTNGRYKRIILGCIFLMTIPLLFSATLLAQNQPQTETDETGFYYTVQKGDTLWDISKKFFNSPELWPDLWGQNGQIANPHWIYPGNRLHIYQRGGKIYVEEASSEKTLSAAPEPATSVPSESAYLLYSAMDQVGFIRNPAVSPSGVIFKVLGDKTLISNDDTVYIRREGKDDMPVGSRFTVFRTYKPVKDPANQKETLGVQHYLVGVVEVTKEEDGYVLATVTRNYRTIEINDQVMPYEKQADKIVLSSEAGQASGTLLFTEDQTELIGDNVIAFIDKGEEDGIRAGQQYRLYFQEKEKISPDAKEAVLLPSVSAGAFFVLRTEPATATVLVIGSSSDVKPGIKFGPMATE